MGLLPASLTAVGSTLFFTANDGTDGSQLWESNGTSNGTVMVTDINPGGVGLAPKSLTAVGSTLFFAANDGTHGSQLWESNGTSSGTVMVTMINGTAGCYLSSLTNVNGTLYFSAYTAAYGYQVWQSDGTSSGTVMDTNIERWHDLIAYEPRGHGYDALFHGARGVTLGADVVFGRYKCPRQLDGFGDQELRGLRSGERCCHGSSAHSGVGAAKSFDGNAQR